MEKNLPKDGCLQAHLLVVITQKIFILQLRRLELKTLVGDQGYFPLERRPLHLRSHCRKKI